MLTVKGTVSLFWFSNSRYRYDEGEDEKKI